MEPFGQSPTPLAGLVIRSGPDHEAFAAAVSARRCWASSSGWGLWCRSGGAFPETWAGVRTVARIWPWALGAGMAGYLGLVPGTLFLHALWETPPDKPVYVLMVLAFGGLVLALAGARACTGLEALHMRT
ncbi:hypothetical protein [Pseudarthrobacter sp. NamB4]|uniref:hypothetical protein n=1 Tax=Pseudarthrobacter sp. NamB4 TaxID=2576837 RepID=UPI0010FD4B2C|nr:hypothetical protein [Pseudarthrobacter sp. NamB4]TLM70552.1 hypothetical protein FDW81_17455 [Pseudarthrobacter sp. NamB4]